MGQPGRKMDVGVFTVTHLRSSKRMTLEGAELVLYLRSVQPEVTMETWRGQPSAL